MSLIGKVTKKVTALVKKKDPQKTVNVVKKKAESTKKLVKIVPKVVVTKVKSQPKIKPVTKIEIKKTPIKTVAKAEIKTKEKKDFPDKVLIYKPEHEIVRPSEDKIASFIARVRSRGFVTETELLYVFPEIEEYVYDYELTLESLQRNNIKIIEDSGSFLDTNSNISKKEQLATIIGTDKDRLKFDISELSSDSIQMYLREIGKVPLL